MLLKSGKRATLPEVLTSIKNENATDQWRYNNKGTMQQLLFGFCRVLFTFPFAVKVARQLSLFISCTRKLGQFRGCSAIVNTDHVNLQSLGKEDLEFLGFLI